MGIVIDLSSGGGGGIPSGAKVFDYTAINYTDLTTVVAPTANEGDLAIVYNSQGIWLINRKLKGVYIYQGGTWEYASQELQDKIQENTTEITVVETDLNNHIADNSNPHLVTKAQVGLGNVDNTSDLDKPISNDTQTALDTKLESVTGDGVDNTDPINPVLSFPNADEVDDSTTSNKFVKKLYVDLDSAESTVSRAVAGGRTTFTITHNLNSKDIIDRVYRLSDDRRINWRIETPTVNTLEASRAGTVADGLFRILIIT
jgi:hypothetical protein